MKQLHLYFPQNQARLGGGGDSRGWHDPPPPPPRDHKAENLPQRHPPESTKLHQFVAKNRTKIPGGHDPLNLRLLFAQRQI